jgi:hypothetical protein
MERLTSFCFFCLKTVEKSKIKEHSKGQEDKEEGGT